MLLNSYTNAKIGLYQERLDKEGIRRKTRTRLPSKESRVAQIIIDSEAKDSEISLPNNPYKLTRKQTLFGSMLFMTALMTNLAPAMAVESMPKSSSKNKQEKQQQKIAKTHPSFTPSPTAGDKAQIEIPTTYNAERMEFFTKPPKSVEKQQPNSGGQEQIKKLNELIARACEINKNYQGEHHDLLSPQKATRKILEALPKVMPIEELILILEKTLEKGEKIKIDFSLTIPKNAPANTRFRDNHIKLNAELFSQHTDNNTLTSFLSNEMHTIKIMTIKKEFHHDRAKLTDEEYFLPFTTMEEARQLEKNMYDGLIKLFENAISSVLSNDRATDFLVNIFRYTKIDFINKLKEIVPRTLRGKEVLYWNEFMKRVNSKPSNYGPLQWNRQLGELDSDIASLVSVLTKKQKQYFKDWIAYHKTFLNQHVKVSTNNGLSSRPKP